MKSEKNIPLKLALLPLIPYIREARHIAVVNTFGLGMGIHSFYLTSKYKFIDDLRKRQIGIIQNKLVFWLLLLVK